MKKLIFGCLLLTSSALAFADEPAKTPEVAPETCVAQPSKTGQNVTQCGGFVTIQEKDKVTVCNLGSPGTKPVCQEIPKEVQGNNP